MLSLNTKILKPTFGRVHFFVTLNSQQMGGLYVSKEKINQLLGRHNRCMMVNNNKIVNRVVNSDKRK